MGGVFKKVGRLAKSAVKGFVGTATLGAVGHSVFTKGGQSAEAAARDALAAREQNTPVMPDEEAIKRAARKRLAGQASRGGRASTFLSDPSEGL